MWKLVAFSDSSAIFCKVVANLDLQVYEVMRWRYKSLPEREGFSNAR